ncbi:MAG: hypothetical protein J5802_05740 [Butyrivibrio sp.]|nr:hypothetical protein [Butyrivibrio sp.]
MEKNGRGKVTQIEFKIPGDSSERERKMKWIAVDECLYIGYITALSAMLEKNGEMIFSIIHPVYSAQYPKAHGERFPEDEEWVVDYLNHSERAYPNRYWSILMKYDNIH